MTAVNDKKFRIALAGGGTGGHFYPAIAIGMRLQEDISGTNAGIKPNILYFGSSLGIEKDLIKNFECDYHLFPVKGLDRQMNLGTMAMNIWRLIRAIFSYFRIRKILKKNSPVCLIGTGSYSSALPVAAAVSLGIPVYLQEQNAYPGLITRRFAAKAEKVFYAYEEIRSHISTEAELVLSGNPVRRSLEKIPREEAAAALELNGNELCVFIFGGSQGSRAINRAVENFIPVMLKRWNVQIIWQTGPADYEMIIGKMPSHPRLLIKAFIHQMEQPYSLCDLVISRAGALSLVELQHLKIPSILVPLPSAAANHQLHNARALEKSGAARVVEEKELPAGSLYNELQQLMDEPERINKMKQAMDNIKLPDTLSIISDNILKDLDLA